MKLIEIAEKTWHLSKDKIIARHCPKDMGDKYKKYQDAKKIDCDAPGGCEYCWEQEVGCEYIKTCPSASGWCINQEPSPDCIDFLQNAYQRYEKEELPRNRDKTAQKPGRNRGKIKARRYRDNIQEDRRAGRKGGRNRNAVYIHQKVPTLPFTERHKRILRKFRNS